MAVSQSCLLGFFFRLQGPPPLPPSRPWDESTVSKAFSHTVETIHRISRTPLLLCSHGVSCVVGTPGNIIGSSLGLLSEWVRHVSLLLPVMVCCLSYLTETSRPGVFNQVTLITDGLSTGNCLLTSEPGFFLSSVPCGFSSGGVKIQLNRLFVRVGMGGMVICF